MKIPLHFNGLKAHTLEQLAQALELKNQPDHRALNDVLATGELFYFLLNEM